MPDNSIENIEKNVKMIAAEVADCEIGEVDIKSEFFKDLGIDSIKAIEITVLLERKFGVSIRDSQVEKIVSVENCVELVQKLLKKKEKKK